MSPSHRKCWVGGFTVTVVPLLQVQPKVNTFNPFGNGPRACPGAELAKLEILIFLHRFVTTYE